EQCRVLELEGRGPGNALCLLVECEHVTEVVTSFGDKGRRAEDVAQAAVNELQRWLAAEVPVGEHLADQLLIPMALAAAGFADHAGGAQSSFVCAEPSMHTRTNAEIIARFLPVVFDFEGIGDGRTRVRCQAREDRAS
ncbi:MAG: hypothetical protein KC457_36085, partial [Myxococcales bacterium]|nr:hypothetical protein [Myxococcales bacterium]